MKPGRHLLLGVPLLMSCIGLHGQPGPLNDWQVIARPPNMELRGLAHKEGTFVGVAYGTNMVISTNGGANWFLLPVSFPGYRGAMAVTEGAGQFVAVGWSGNILTSPDGLQWTQRRGGSQMSYEEFWAVTYGPDRFVAVGFQGNTNHGTIAATSTDGVEWEKVVLPFDTTPRNIAYGKGLYVAAGLSFSMYSSNGRDWTPLNQVPGQAIAFGGGEFIAATSTWQPAYRSSNGVDWTQFLLPSYTYYGNYFTATYDNGMFMLGGFCDTCPNNNRPGLLATSVDGRQWTLRVFGGGEIVGPIRDIAFADGRYYLADSWLSKIWKSGRILPVTQPAITQVSRYEGRTTLSFSTVPGFRYRVESVDRLGSAGWGLCQGPFFATGQELIVSDPGPDQSRFYRVRSE